LDAYDSFGFAFRVAAFGVVVVRSGGGEFCGALLDQPGIVAVVPEPLGDVGETLGSVCAVTVSSLTASVLVSNLAITTAWCRVRSYLAMMPKTALKLLLRRLQAGRLPLPPQANLHETTAIRARRRHPAKPQPLRADSAKNFNQANLISANLSGANLSRADLTKANLTGAYLIEADLTGAGLATSTGLGTHQGSPHSPSRLGATEEYCKLRISPFRQLVGSPTGATSQWTGPRQSPRPPHHLTLRPIPRQPGTITGLHPGCLPRLIR
jgi:hypothetical protein